MSGSNMNNQIWSLLTSMESVVPGSPGFLLERARQANYSDKYFALNANYPAAPGYTIICCFLH
jgi:hypothetical protein